MISEFRKIKNFLDDGININRYVLLSVSKDFLDGEVVFNKLEKDINYKRELRIRILKKIEKDILKILYLNGIKNININISEKEVFKNNYLNINIINENTRNTLLINRESFIGDNNKLLNDISKIIQPVVNGVFFLSDNDNILNNDFYKDLYVYFAYKSYPIFCINGRGISIANNNFTDKEITILNNSLNINKDNILKGITVFNNTILDNYRTNNGYHYLIKKYERGVK